VDAAACEALDNQAVDCTDRSAPLLILLLLLLLFWPFLAVVKHVNK
jgi:hypothetical protein